MSPTCRTLLALAAGCAVETPGLVVDVAVGAPTTRTPSDAEGVPWTVEAATLGLASVGLVPCADDPLAAGPDASVRVDLAVDLVDGGHVGSIPVPPGRWCAVRLEPRRLDGCAPACAWTARLGPPGAIRDVAGLGAAQPPVALPTPLDVDRSHRYASLTLGVDPDAWLDGLPTDASDDQLAEALTSRILATLVPTPEESP